MIGAATDLTTASYGRSEKMKPSVPYSSIRGRANKCYLLYPMEIANKQMSRYAIQVVHNDFLAVVPMRGNGQYRTLLVRPKQKWTQSTAKHAKSILNRIK